MLGAGEARRFGAAGGAKWAPEWASGCEGAVWEPDLLLSSLVVRQRLEGVVVIEALAVQREEVERGRKMEQ